MEKIGAFLKKFLAKNEVTLNNNYSSFFKSWDKIAGEPLSAYSKVIDISGNQLIVQVDHPGWVQMFQYNENRILKSIQKKYPELKIKAIKLIIVEKKAENIDEIIEEETAEITGEEYKFTEEEKKIFKNIKNSALKNKLLKLYSAAVKKNKKQE